MNKNFDLFIPLASKDRNKLKFLLYSVEKYIKGIVDIYVVVNNIKQFEDHIPNTEHRLYLLEKKDVLDMDVSKFKYRPEWVQQQYLKLFQNITRPLYLTIDSDVVINRPLFMFEDNKPICYLGQEQYNEPYFRFQEKMLDLPRIYPHSFINDMNFFDRNIITNMLYDSKYHSAQSFIEKSYDIIDNDCYPAEPEIFGQYVQKKCPYLYNIKQAKTLQTARWANSYDDIVWTDDEIKNEIKRMSELDYDMFTLHTWYLEKV